MNKHSEIIDVIIRNNKLLLSDNIIELLSAKPGDRINIGYIEKDGNMIPIICIDAEGNKLNKNNTISFRGKQQEFLGQFGSNFWAVNNEGTIELEGDGIPVYTDVKKAVEAYITKEIILDTNYNITKINNYEF